MVPTTAESISGSGQNGNNEIPVNIGTPVRQRAIRLRREMRSELVKLFGVQIGDRPVIHLATCPVIPRFMPAQLLFDSARSCEIHFPGSIGMKLHVD
jgi:hypothetical protein